MCFSEWIFDNVNLPFVIVFKSLNPISPRIDPRQKCGVWFEFVYKRKRRVTENKIIVKMASRIAKF